MNVAPLSRWRVLRFSLRTLFLVLTAIGLFLGWNSHRLSQRRALLDTIQASGGFWGTTPAPRKPMPLAWRLFGVQRYDMVWLPNELYVDEQFFQRAESLLPEAELVDLSPGVYQELMTSNLESFDKPALVKLLVNMPDAPEFRRELEALDAPSLRLFIKQNPELLGSRPPATEIR
jgi:hypothetical protein